MILGAQMYTVRDLCKDQKGIAESLKKIADIGYTTVQVSGFDNFDPNWLKAELDKNGLKCVLTHLNRDKIAAEPEAMVDEHKILDCKNIGIGWYEIHKTGIDEFYNKYINSANVIHNAGLQLHYHNHDHEFTQLDGKKTILETMAEKFTPDQLKFVIDTFWVQAGGADPAKFIQSFKDRCPCVHLKDMAYDKIMRPVGSGNMNFESIISACENANTEYLLVEQDKCYDSDPFDCLETSYNYLTSLGLR